MMTAYDDFDLEILSSNGRYLVRLINSPYGQANAEFESLLTNVERESFYSRIGQGHRNRSGESKGELAAKFLGERLFSKVFAGDLLSQFRLCESLSKKQNRGTRIRLRLKSVPELAELPWEFLYDKSQDHFVATSIKTPIVRYMDLEQEIDPLDVLLPLRILVVIPSPSRLQQLDTKGEWDRLNSSLAGLIDKGMVTLERLPSSTLDSLRIRARRDPFHILHFIGHGTFDAAEKNGVLFFENASGMPDPVAGQKLGNILRDHDSLRLVVLNACEGARQSDEDSFSGVAQSLCRQHLPAVIAMQFEISDNAAKKFAEEFYECLAMGFPVDAAVGESRRALYNGPFGQEWATPVLYMRSSNGQLFVNQSLEDSDIGKTDGRHQRKLSSHVKSGADFDSPSIETKPIRPSQKKGRTTQLKARSQTSEFAEQKGVKKPEGSSRTIPRKREPQLSQTPSTTAERALSSENKIAEFSRHEAAALAGDMEAMWQVVVCYNRGLGVPKDDSKAAKWAEKAAAAGHLDSIMMLGDAYRNGIGVEQDYAKAVKWYRKAAKAGDGLALNNLGWMHAHGWGVDRDLAKAKMFYERSVLDGYAIAADNLATMYEKGNGVAKDLSKALLLLEAAAGGNYRDSMMSLHVLLQYKPFGSRQISKEWERRALMNGKRDARTRFEVSSALRAALAN